MARQPQGGTVSLFAEYGRGNWFLVRSKILGQGKDFLVALDTKPCWQTVRNPHRPLSGCLAPRAQGWPEYVLLDTVTGGSGRPLLITVFLGLQPQGRAKKPG